MRLGQTIRRLRQAKGLTQEQLARKIKTTRPFVTMVEAGARTPRLAILQRIAKALGVPVAELLE
jgi:transcriptional regulator with XRE-family HTH domain